MPFTPYAAKLALDWATGISTTRPAGQFLQFATAAPDANNEYNGPFTSRMTATFAAANSPQGSATNLNALVRTATAIATVVGWNLYDQITAGNRIEYGTVTAAIGCASGDGCRFAAGALVITLA